MYSIDIVICTLLTGIVLLYVVYRYSIREKRPSSHKEKKQQVMNESERQFEIDIKRSWHLIRGCMIGQFLVMLFCIYLYFSPPFPIVGEISPAYINILGTLTAVAWALISLFVFHPSIVIFRHRLMLIFSQSGWLTILATFSCYMGMGGVPPTGEKDAVFFVFAVFMETMVTFLFLVYCAIYYQDRIERMRGYVEP